MTFPSKPRTSDARRTELLRLFAVPGYPNVFILGSHARYVTVYNQQVRALNLVAALAKTGYLSEHSRVGVVGGGIAGLTAAVAAAQARVAHVQVYESELTVMPRQRMCDKRYIHPHIYDWPDDIALDESAGLPMMSWTADTAAHVVIHLEKEFAAEQKKAEGRLANPKLGATVALGKGARPTLVVDGAPEEFDVVILAVGFGLDETDHTLGYWTDDELGAARYEQQKGTWLVSGSGDGALTDLMRLRIPYFQHRSVLEKVNAATRDQVGQTLREIDASDADAKTRRDAFLAAAKQVNDALSTLPFRDVGTVYLNSDEDHLFEGGSSVLNRLIAAWLLHNDQFKFAPGKIKPPLKVGNRYLVEFEDGTRLDADHLVIRHGPKSPYATQPSLIEPGNATLAIRDAWRGIRQFQDWTREVQLLDEEVPFEDLSRVLRVDFDGRVGCVIVVGKLGVTQDKGRPIAIRVKDALKRIAQRKATEKYAPGRAVDLDPVVLDVEDVLSSTTKYERAVRALCTADIAIFDLTAHESAIMLLLGIRAAVRRGVTTTVTMKQEKTPPFNIASLNPVLFDTRYVEKQADALEAAFETLASVPDFYLDLPVYDAVRTLGDDYRTRHPDEEVLVLRWFDDDYELTVGNELIRNQLTTRWEHTTVLTTLDSSSPQLVEQRLYTAIRRDKLCIADWTSARPNVFFEIGVRLAVSEHHPQFILCEDPPPTYDAQSVWRAGDPWRDALERLFGVTRFSLKDDSALAERIEKENEFPESLLSPGRTYRVVLEAIDKRQEPGGEPLERWLLRQAGKLSGPPVETGGVPVLYSEVLKAQVRDAAAERTLAAWHYLTGRHDIFEKMDQGTIASGDPILKLAEEVGLSFSAQARDSTEEFKTIAEKLRPQIRRIRAYRKEKHDGRPA